MKIIILGAGRVGASVAENLVSEDNDITIIDRNPALLSSLQDQQDLRTLVGNGTLPSVLREAGAEDADVLIAVAQSDETNLVACAVAARLFNIPTRIARLRGSEFQQEEKLMGEEGFGVSKVICPEQRITDTINRLIELPEALQVLEFAQGALSLIAVRAYAGGPLVSMPIETLRTHIPNVDVRIVAIFRNGRQVPCEGYSMVQPGDEVFFLSASIHVRAVMKELRRMDKPIKNVLIAGGGNIGLRLARQLEEDYQVKLIERDVLRCDYLASQLNRAMVLRGDATDEDLLNDEYLDGCDLFISLTADDEDNIMSALLAKRKGARRVIALINRRSYAELMQGSQIDIAISPDQATIGELLAQVRRGDTVAVHNLRGGAAEALEIVAHGDAKSSKVVGRTIQEIELPHGATIGAIVRGKTVLMAHHDTVIENDDHVILFVTHKPVVHKIEKLFQVRAGFF
ncbi:MAG: Trk system potassium transporter TrkA [Burkholderiaceae bacterium]|nr:MAG: Trk system potassium transporter TrkA [Burkholderiaceae bacterium]